MTQNVERIVQFLVCPQNDFMARPGEPGYPERVSMLHVGSDAVLKLRGDGRPGSRDPFVETMHRFFRDGDPGTSRLQVVIDEDWHPRHCEEFSTFGEHCVRGSPGAELPGGAQDNRYHHRCHVIRANSICIASDHHYAGVLQKACGNVRSESIRVGVFGVWTHVKVEYLVVGLNAFPPNIPFSNMAICEPLCASPQRRFHDAAIEKFREFGIRVFVDVDEYCRDWLGLGPG